MLKFSRGNAKLDALESVVGGQVWTYSMLSGYSCPYAKACLSQAVRGVDNKATIVDGPHTQFRCFSASEEAMYPNVYDARNHNYMAVKACENNTSEMASLILSSLPAKARCVRVHVGGDMFSQPYFDAWMYTAAAKPDVLFYAYTKSLPFWLSARQRKIIPDNFVLTASRGGYRDEMISLYRFREAVVIADSDTVQAVIDSGNHDVIPIGPYKGYEIDHDDRHAALPELRDKSFALLIHGTQPKGSESAQAKKILGGVGSYSQEKQCAMKKLWG